MMRRFATQLSMAYSPTLPRMKIGYVNIWHRNSWDDLNINLKKQLISCVPSYTTFLLVNTSRMYSDSMLYNILY